METLYRLVIHPSLSLEEAWDALEAENIEILYGCEEEGKIEIFAHLQFPDILLSHKKIVASYEPHILPSIDWEEQWTAHGHNFQNGYVHLDLAPFQHFKHSASSPSLRLQPGPGFGDLSHPTTRLLLRLFARHLRGEIVIDIGCGSGVLTLAAAALGALKAYGIDIDEEALAHSRQNACLNQLDQKCFFCLPKECPLELPSEQVIILMNMIQSEQQIAWESLPQLHKHSNQCFTSGIRIEEKQKYLEQTARWGWRLQEELEEMGWLAFHFKSEF